MAAVQLAPMSHTLRFSSWLGAARRGEASGGDLVVGNFADDELSLVNLEPCSGSAEGRVPLTHGSCSLVSLGALHQVHPTFRFRLIFENDFQKIYLMLPKIIT
jgi:hypothetical protein